MKIELENNKVFFENQGLKKEIHPFWLRERVNGDNFVDKKTQQRLFDPTELQKNVKIDSLNISNDCLEIKFNGISHIYDTLDDTSSSSFGKILFCISKTCTSEPKAL